MLPLLNKFLGLRPCLRSRSSCFLPLFPGTVVAFTFCSSPSAYQGSCKILCLLAFASSSPFEPSTSLWTCFGLSFHLWRCLSCIGVPLQGRIHLKKSFLHSSHSPLGTLSHTCTQHVSHEQGALQCWWQEQSSNEILTEHKVDSIIHWDSRFASLQPAVTRFATLYGPPFKKIHKTIRSIG